MARIAPSELTTSKFADDWRRLLALVAQAHNLDRVSDIAPLGAMSPEDVRRVIKLFIKDESHLDTAPLTYYRIAGVFELYAKDRFVYVQWDRRKAPDDQPVAFVASSFKTLVERCLRVHEPETFHDTVFTHGHVFVRSDSTRDPFYAATSFINDRVRATFPTPKNIAVHAGKFANGEGWAVTYEAAERVTE